jgi:hypothetical protein
MRVSIPPAVRRARRAVLAVDIATAVAIAAVLAVVLAW